MTRPRRVTRRAFLSTCAVAGARAVIGQGLPERKASGGLGFPDPVQEQRAHQYHNPSAGDYRLRTLKDWLRRLD